MEPSLGSRIWSGLLGGIPFGIYKFGFGWFQYHLGHPAMGIAAMTWGSIDIVLNLVAIAIPKRVDWCLLSNIGRLIDGKCGTSYWRNVLLGIDTTAAFLIVSCMIWFGLLPLEPPLMACIWNIAVVANVMSVGLNQVYTAIIDRGRGSELEVVE